MRDAQHDVSRGIAAMKELWTFVNAAMAALVVLGTAQAALHVLWNSPARRWSVFASARWISDSS